MNCHRFTRTFGLRTLLLGILLSAIAFASCECQLPPYEARAVRLGMTMDEVLDRLGATSQFAFTGGFGGNELHYFYGSWRLSITF